MENILSDLDSSSLVSAIKSNLNGFFKHLQKSSVAQTKTEGNEFYWTTPVAHPWFNGVISDGTSTNEMSEIIDRTFAFFNVHNIPSFTWWLNPELDLDEWSNHLVPRGFSLVDSPPGMAIDLAKLPPLPHQQATIEIVQDDEKLSEWTETFAVGYELPKSIARPFYNLFKSIGTGLPFRHYLFRLDGKPVSTSTLYLGAGVAGIYNVATLPEARGKGIGSLMTLAPLHEARDLGYRAGILQSSDMGFSVYQKLGFEKLCNVTHFYWQSNPTE